MTKEEFDKLNGCLKTPAEWCECLRMRIIDPDGWRGRHALDMETPIRLRDFVTRSMISTIGVSHPRVSEFFEAARMLEQYPLEFDPET